MRGDRVDSSANYDARGANYSGFLPGMEKHSDEFQAEWYGNGDKFFRTMEHNMSKFQRQSLDVAMNELSNQSHSFPCKTKPHCRTWTGRMELKYANENGKKCILQEAVVMQMIGQAPPTVYYGDEAGMVGWTDSRQQKILSVGKTRLGTYRVS